MFRFKLWVLSALLGFDICVAKLIPDKNLEPHILNGAEASPDQFPWQVVLVCTGDTSQWYCGGVLVKEDWVLTAGHCGSFMMSATAMAANASIRGYNFVRPDGYDDYTLANDIGLLQLEEPFQISDVLKPIDFLSEPLGSNVNITVSGWGATGDAGSGLSSTLLYANLSTIDNAECKKTYGKNTIRDEMFCAVSIGSVTQGTCFGDNGGPAIIYHEGNPLLVGIASFVSDRGCEKGDPSGFTRIAEFVDWIKLTVGI